MTVYRKDIEELEMDLTGLCNLHCYICTRNFMHSQHMMAPGYVRPMTDIISQLDTFVGLKRFFIAGTMSEPTLHPQFFEFLEYLNKRDIYYELFTNGGTHDDKWWKELGKIVPEKCMTCFTICGSTNALHSYYRVGSNLDSVLNHAASYRLNGKHNDYCQHILFEYNQKDYENGNMHPIFKQFSHSFQVHSEGRRLHDEKIVQPPFGIYPPKRIKSSIDYIFSKMPRLHSILCVKCKMQEQKKAYIDCKGNVYPCYTYAEGGHPSFLINADQFNLNPIYSYSYPECYLCSTDVYDMIKAFKLQFIC